MDEGRRNELQATAGPLPIAAGGLPYLIELWDEARRAPQQVLARAASLGVAREMFRACARERPDRLIVLRCGYEILDSHG
ncbi:hypothetical protein [Phenylobacterium sp.]|uniref:hypothetical protein n=1 Tax=Phenylobacterium sp. TaxID=1871053 RepID=UPI0035AEAF3D